MHRGGITASKFISLPSSYLSALFSSLDLLYFSIFPCFFCLKCFFPNAAALMGCLMVTKYFVSCHPSTSDGFTQSRLSFFSFSVFIVVLQCIKLKRIKCSDSILLSTLSSYFVLDHRGRSFYPRRCLCGSKLVLSPTSCQIAPCFLPSR